MCWMMGKTLPDLRDTVAILDDDSSERMIDAIFYLG